MPYPPNPARPPEPPPFGAESDILLGYLERQRATFAWKTGELSAEQLNTPHPPSTLTLGGMIKHFTRFEDDMSTEWLHGETQIAPWNAVDWETNHDWDWRTAADDPPETLYRTWETAVLRSRERLEAAMANGGPNRHASGETPSLRYVLLNMIEEYACHNGHADLIRESIDGITGHDPPA